MRGRVQNYDAKTHSLGYRDVNINLRFTSPLAQRLCVHLHICEVLPLSRALLLPSLIARSLRVLLACFLATDTDTQTATEKPSHTTTHTHRESIRFWTVTCLLARGCERVQVQLLLTPFAKLKSSAGHKRYVAFRNARGK